MRLFVFLSVWALAHVYLHRRVIRPLTGASAVRLWGGRAVVFAMVVLPPLYVFATRAGVPLPRAAAWPAYVSMGFSATAIALTGLAELVRLPLTLAGRAGPVERITGRSLDPGRRRFFGTVVNASVVGATATIGGVGIANARSLARVVDVDVPIPGLPPQLHGYRILQLSDVHIGPSLRGTDLEAIVARSNEQRADLVVLTGDLIDGHVEDLASEVAAFGRLEARDGVYAVTGNHEYYWDGPAWCRHLESLGVRVLCNTHDVVDVEGARLLVAGVTDYGAGARVEGHRSDPPAAKRGAPAHDVSLLLAHQPRSVFEAARAGFDLQLSGHTHGGQLFPFTSIVSWVQPYVAGLNRHENMWIYVSRGTGYWGPPMRTRAQHEITVLRLVAAGSDGRAHHDGDESARARPLGSRRATSA